MREGGGGQRRQRQASKAHPCAASGRRPTAGQQWPPGASERERTCEIFGPPHNSMAVAPASVQMSAWLSSGKAVLTGRRMSRSMFRPAFAPSSLSGAKRIVAPLLPPVPSSLEYVPEELSAHSVRLVSRASAISKACEVDSPKHTLPRKPDGHRARVRLLVDESIADLALYSIDIEGGAEVGGRHSSSTIGGHQQRELRQSRQFQ